MLRQILNAGTSTLQNTALLGANVAVLGLVGGLTALTLMAHFEDTPEIRDLACFVGVERTDCPDYGAKLREAKEREKRLRLELDALERKRQGLEADKAAIEAERQSVESQLVSLRTLLDRFDSLMGFEHEDSPNGKHRLTIGTRYKTFVDLNEAVEGWQCSFNLPDGSAGEDRSLYFRTVAGERSVSSRQLQKANIDPSTLAWAKDRCRPLSPDGDS